MKTISIYRLEHKVCGQGPYNCGKTGFNNDLLFLVADMKQNHQSLSHPNVHADFDEAYDYLCDNYVCGCLSHDDLRNWFGFYLESLLESGLFHVVQYEVPINKHVVGYSGKQCLFKKSKSFTILN